MRSVYEKPIAVNLGKTGGIVRTACILYSWLRLTSSGNDLSPCSINYEDLETGTVESGSWRSHTIGSLQLATKSTAD